MCAKLADTVGDSEFWNVSAISATPPGDSWCQWCRLTKRKDKGVEKQLMLLGFWKNVECYRKQQLQKGIAIFCARADVTNEMFLHQRVCPDLYSATCKAPNNLEQMQGYPSHRHAKILVSVARLYLRLLDCRACYEAGQTMISGHSGSKGGRWGVSLADATGICCCVSIKLKTKLGSRSRYER